MSHTSQRRGLKAEHPGEEIIVLAMIPREYKQKVGIESAMSELAEKILAHHPHLWISHNFVELDIPRLGSMQSILRLMHRIRPEATRDLLMLKAAEKSSVITAIYTNPQNVYDLLDDIQGDWLETNRRKGYPISIVLSGLFDDVHKCCKHTGRREHTYLHSLGFFGQTGGLPGESELELVTMCGHGLISINRVRDLVGKIQRKALTPKEAAEDIARPCVCGIVNRDRAEKILRRLAKV